MPDATTPPTDAPGPVNAPSPPVPDAVIALIARASAQEHGLACVGLFAAASLKSDASEGHLTDAQAAFVRGWKRGLLQTARDRFVRMAHLAALTTALGGSPHPLRPWPTWETLGGEGGVAPTLVPFSPSVVAHLAEGDNDATEGAPETLESLYTAITTAIGALPAPVTSPPGTQAAEHPRNLLAALHARATSGRDATLGAEYATALADAQMPGAPFEPVRPVAADPTLRTEERAVGGAAIVNPVTRAVATLFVDAYDTFLRVLPEAVATLGPPDAADDAQDSIAMRLLDSVLRPLGDALARMPLDCRASVESCAGPPFGDVASDDDAPVAPSDASIDDRLWRLATTATTLCEAQAAFGLPSEVGEATAALQDLGCRRPPDAPARRATLRAMQSGLRCGIQSAVNGPYIVTNVDTLTTWLGEPLPAQAHMALCRCGNSRLKPFCDGSHARVDFSGRKDPARVSDRRDTYVGTQVTILDNRGTCAHSAFCTDRLTRVFRLGEDPFVVPNGARLDDIVRAVRACPSGALSFALDGAEIRDGVDQRRPPAIEVSKDGPYRVTGGIALSNGQGNDEPRNVGASHEHYSLCRCGHSQNKPFCSGMHWSVTFRDPVLPADHRPTLFEWAGGLPALTRMTRLFYDTHVPQDPLLEPLFAHMSPDHPERVAAWLGEVFGGPPVYSTRYGGGTSQGGYHRMVSEHRGAALTEEQRARWARLMTQSAEEASLPSDPEFRAAFAAYIEWGSRLAVENSTPGAHPPMNMPMPRWDWVCNATPWGRVSALAPQPTEEETTSTVPAAGEAMHFDAHIKPLFRQMDRQSMTWAFDLWAYKDVATHASAILARLQAGTMPCDSAWPQERIDLFARWVAAGTPE